MNSLKDRVVRTVRANLNEVLDRIRDFEDQGGIDGLFNRDQERLGDGRSDSHTEAPQSGFREKTIRDYYANLEVPYGSDLKTVKASYVRLMRRYHPDRHSNDPEMEAMATELSQELSQAYSAVRAWLKNGRY